MGCNYIVIPGTDIRIYDGTVVTIARFPDTRWIVHYGFYTFDGVKQKGWYFESIPAGTMIPVIPQDLVTVTIISTPAGPINPTPCPPPIPPVPPMPEGVERYRPGVKYFKGKILYIIEGELYQAVETFRASYSESTVEANFEKDIAAGYFVSIPNNSDLDEIESKIANKMDLQSDAIAGNIAVFDNYGQVIDSNTTFEDIQPLWDDGD